MDTNVTYEFEYLNHSLEELKSYLLSDELFWPITERSSSGGEFLRLTIGNVLLSMKKLDALKKGGHLSPGQQVELGQIEQAVETTRQQWQVAWEKKAEREFKSRLAQWGNLLRDIKQDFEVQAAYYPHEVRLRVLMELLSEGEVEIEEYDLAPLDNYIKARLKGSEFIWAGELEPGFPKDVFWYLYGSLNKV